MIVLAYTGKHKGQGLRAWSKQASVLASCLDLWWTRCL
jgi:hypothetical protein